VRAMLGLRRLGSTSGAWRRAVSARARGARLAALAALGLALASPDARAQGVNAPSVNLRGFSPSPDPGATLYLEPVATPGAGVFHVAGWLSYAHRPLVLRDPAGELVGKAIERQIIYDQAIGIGVGSRLGLGLVLPIVVFQSSEEIGPVRTLFAGAFPPEQALGDLTLAGKYAFLPPGELGGFGLGVVGRLTLPTGLRQGTMGEGAVTAETRLLAELGLAAVKLQATAGVKVRPIHRTFGGNTWGEELPWGAAILLKPQIFGVDEKGRWALGVETHGSLPLAPSAPFSNATLTPAYAGGTVRFTPGAINLLFGAEAALSRAAGAPPVRAVIQIGYVPRSHDKDKDGVDDEVDDCPGLPEDRDGFQDTDGCPELDNDDDGVLDPDDKCPTQKEDADGDRDEDGCPDPDDGKAKKGAAPAAPPAAPTAPAAPAAPNLAVPEVEVPPDAGAQAPPKGKPGGKGRPKKKKR
jgi:OOP family OmpA-OmpF porin